LQHEDITIVSLDARAPRWVGNPLLLDFACLLQDNPRITTRGLACDVAEIADAPLCLQCENCHYDGVVGNVRAFERVLGNPVADNLDDFLDIVSATAHTAAKHTVRAMCSSMQIAKWRRAQRNHGCDKRKVVDHYALAFLARRA
jgi:hypothetical protein